MSYHQILTIIKNHLKLNPSLLLLSVLAERESDDEDGRGTSDDIKWEKKSKYTRISFNFQCYCGSCKGESQDEEHKRKMLRFV